MARKNKRQLLREEIRADLLMQLQSNGTIGKYYTDLVDDYMKLWDTKGLLYEDIKARGVTVENTTAYGKNLKKNDSVDQAVKVNAQMLKLLDNLGISPAQTDGGLDDEM